MAIGIYRAGGRWWREHKIDPRKATDCRHQIWTWASLVDRRERMSTGGGLRRFTAGFRWGGWRDLSKNEILLRFVFHNKNTHYSHTSASAYIYLYIFVLFRVQFVVCVVRRQNFIVVDEKIAIIHLPHY